MATGRPDRPPDVHLPFDHQPDAPRQARQAVRPLVSDPGDPIAEAVTLSASELVTNVIRHTHEGGIMRAWDPKPGVPLRLEVEDHDPTPPRPPTITPDQPSGRGIRLVSAVANKWGVDPVPDGKVVWAEFDRNGPSSVGDTDTTE